jgi:hypothetical protein
MGRVMQRDASVPAGRSVRMRLSTGRRTVRRMMREAHSAEVEKVLLHLSDARARARRAADTVGRTGAEEHVVDALRETERRLGELHRSLAQGTYYAVPDNAPGSSA